MISMVDKQKIIHYYRTCGISKREIARLMKCSRHIVDKIVTELEDAIGGPDEALKDAQRTVRTLIHQSLSSCQALSNRRIPLT